MVYLPKQIQNNENKYISLDGLNNCKMDISSYSLDCGHCDMDKIKHYVEGLSDNKQPALDFGLLYVCGYTDTIDKKNVPDKIDRCQACRFLVAEGANVNFQLEGYKTPLAYASYIGDIDLVNLLLSLGADCNFEEDVYNCLFYPIVMACYMNYYDIVEVLLKHGADPNVGHAFEYTPLTCAVRNKNHRLVKLLLDNGADGHIVEILDPNYPAETPLSLALKNDDYETAELLLKNGADPNYGTELLTAVMRNKYDHVKLLITYGADTKQLVPRLNKEPETLLDVAVRRKHYEIAQLLQSV